MAPIIIGAFILLLYFAFLWKYDKELQKESDYLDKREAALEERERLNREDYANLIHTEAEMDEIHSSYVVSDADEMRHNTEKAIYNEARKRIAHNIALDIIHKFKPTWDGKRMEYKFKIKEAE